MYTNFTVKDVYKIVSQRKSLEAFGFLRKKKNFILKCVLPPCVTDGHSESLGVTSLQRIPQKDGGVPPESLLSNRPCDAIVIWKHALFHRYFRVRF